MEIGKEFTSILYAYCPCLLLIEDSKNTQLYQQIIQYIVLVRTVLNAEQLEKENLCPSVP